MPYAFRVALLALFITPLTLNAQPVTPNTTAWDFTYRAEIRANYRQSNDDRFQLRFPFPAEFLPVGEKFGFEQTPDAGSHLELSVAQIRLDASFGKWFNAHTQLHAVDKYRRNPTSSDRKIDADELYIRMGPKPESLERPDGTSFFVQVGKAPKMERQPIRLLESYGLAATAFNRFEDTQALIGGSAGRSFYWRLQLSNGNPVFFRDSNALAGDNGTPEQRQPGHPHPDPAIKSGFPILYNAETEKLFFETENMQFGQGLGYRWQNDLQTAGFDVILFHYKRRLAQEANLTGTFYGGDIDLLDGTFGRSLPITDDQKEEYGGRLYSEWHSLTAIAQFTKQHLAGLQRQGHEVELGYNVPFAGRWVTSIKPAVRWSGLVNRFRTQANKQYPAPSVWWPWTKIDAGVRIGFPRSIDVTIEYAKHNVGSPRKLNVDEALVTLRVRV